MGTCIINFVKPVGDKKQQQNMFESSLDVLIRTLLLCVYHLNCVGAPLFCLNVT